MTIEICVHDEAGAMAAVAGGADRIELCTALELGGLTPSIALLRRVLRHARPAGVTVHAMVRPRAGDFTYDEAELALAIEEGELLLDAGADGLVFGACRSGRLDAPALARWTQAFAPTGKQLSLHRAVDLVADLPAAVEQAIELGFDRILSSGGAVTAPAGAGVLRRMVERADGRCRIAAGSGVRSNNVAALVAQSAVDEIHGSASVALPSIDPAAVALGFAAAPHRVTDREEVAALCAIARNLNQLKSANRPVVEGPALL